MQRSGDAGVADAVADRAAPVARANHSEAMRPSGRMERGKTGGNALTDLAMARRENSNLVANDQLRNLGHRARSSRSNKSAPNGHQSNSHRESRYLVEAKEEANPLVASAEDSGAVARAPKGEELRLKVARLRSDEAFCGCPRPPRRGLPLRVR